jgi:hypothetical protein
MDDSLEDSESSSVGEDFQERLSDSCASKANTFVKYVSKQAWSAVTKDEELSERLDDKLHEVVIAVPRFMHQSPKKLLGTFRRRASFSNRVMPE